ncbi:MAG: hypothetical protein WA584_05705 [Pyrinomonadaceae bacterium]
MPAKLLLFFILLLSPAQIALPQTVKNDKKDEELKKEAAIFLRETAVDVGNLRTLENRISFASEIASLMWYHDEKEARAMFQTVIVDFRQLLIQSDAEFTASQAKSIEEAFYESSLIEGTSNSESKLMRKFRKAISVRQQIALSIAEHDAQMAYDFFTSTSQAVANEELRKQFEESDKYFESRLIYAIAESDVDKALEAARKQLAKGASYELINLLKKIYGKDAEKGAAFGEEIVSKIKSDGTKSINLSLLSILLGEGATSLDKSKVKPVKKPMFSEQALREIADLLAQEILKSDNADISIGYDITLIERFSPARAVLIRQKLKTTNTKMEAVITEGIGNGVGVTERPPVEISNAENQEDLLKDADELADKNLSKEQREKITSQARQIISKIENREQKLFALSALAAQVSKMGDKETAAAIMNEARALVNLQPKNYKDYLGVWILASGYAQSDADKAFPILDDTIGRLNETISAFIKVGEFIDVNEEIIEGEEVQVGGFGGELTRGLLGELGAANSTLKSLAIADFAKTKALTNRFDRTEVRILAKMMVLRAVLGDKEKVNSE